MTAPTPKLGAAMTDSQWILDVMGRYDFTMPQAAFDEIVRKLLARQPAAIGKEAVGQWVHCSPSLLSAGVSCANTPRRACECNPENGDHDHFIAHATAPSVAQDESEAFRAWYSTHKVTGDVAEAAWMARAASTSANVARYTPPQSASPTDAQVIEVLKKIDGWAMEHGLCDSTFPKAVAKVRELFSANVAQGAETVGYYLEYGSGRYDVIPAWATADKNQALLVKQRGSPVYRVAPPAQTALTDGARECLLDVTTHFDNLRAGLCAQRLEATNNDDSDCIVDRVAYWNHEIRVLERMRAQAERALTAAQSAIGGTQ